MLSCSSLKCCGVMEIVRISRAGYPTRMTHQNFAKRYGVLVSENVSSQDPLGVSVAILQQFNILPDMYQVGLTKLFFRTGQIAVLEDARSRTLQGILGVQKHFRGFRTRRNFKEVKNAINMLQAFVRGEMARNDSKLVMKRWRAVILIQKHVKRWIAWKTFNAQRRATVLLQSVVRGWRVRKHIVVMIGLQNHVKVESPLDETVNELKDTGLDHSPLHQSNLAELQRRVFKAEAALRHKDQENISLNEQLKQYETRWSEYEAKMKSMEEMWQKQLTSLQVTMLDGFWNTYQSDELQYLVLIDV